MIVLRYKKNLQESAQTKAKLLDQLHRYCLSNLSIRFSNTTYTPLDLWWIINIPYDQHQQNKSYHISDTAPFATKLRQINFTSKTEWEALTVHFRNKRTRRRVKIKLLNLKTKSFHQTLIEWAGFKLFAARLMRVSNCLIKLMIANNRCEFVWSCQVINFARMKWKQKRRNQACECRWIIKQRSRRNRGAESDAALPILQPCSWSFISTSSNLHRNRRPWAEINFASHASGFLQAKWRLECRSREIDWK